MTAFHDANVSCSSLKHPCNDPSTSVYWLHTNYTAQPHLWLTPMGPLTGVAGKTSRDHIQVKSNRACLRLWVRDRSSKITVQSEWQSRCLAPHLTRWGCNTNPL
jgi:hypothetical protein